MILFFKKNLLLLQNLLTRIFHTDSSRGAVKPDIEKKDVDLRRWLSPSGFHKPQRDQYKICGLVLSLFMLLSGCALFEPSSANLHSFHTVVLDPGHGGYDSGARAVSGLPEKSLTLDVAQRTKPLLEARGYHVVMTRTQDVFIPLGVRTAIANKHPDSVFVSIHFNCSPSSAAKGIETYYYSRPSDRFAASMLRQLLPVYHAHERGVKQATYYVLHRNQRPATLLELGFVSNRSENAIIQKPEIRQQLAEHIAQGIADCHN